MEYPNQSPNKRYPEWFDKYKLYYYKNFVSGNNCYALRCSIVHEGSPDIENQRARKSINYFSFTPNGGHLIQMINIHAGSSDDGKHIVSLSVKEFATDMIKSSIKWLDDVNNNQTIQKRMKTLLKINPEQSLFNGAIRT